MPSLKEISSADKKYLDLMGLNSGNFLQFWAYGIDQTRNECSTFDSVQTRMHRQGIIAFHQHNGRRYEVKNELS